MNLETANLRYLTFLQDILGASNRNEAIVPDQLHKKHHLSTYTYPALKELGWIKVKDDVTRGVQQPIWVLDIHPDIKLAEELHLEAHNMQLECNTYRKQKVQEMQLDQLIGRNTVTITVNGAKIKVPVVNNTIEFEVDGDKIEVVLEL